MPSTGTITLMPRSATALPVYNTAPLAAVPVTITAVMPLSFRIFSRSVFRNLSGPDPPSRLLEHDLVEKPVPTFRDHAPMAGSLIGRLVAGIMRKRCVPCQSRDVAPRLMKHRHPRIIANIALGLGPPSSAAK